MSEQDSPQFWAGMKKYENEPAPEITKQELDMLVDRVAEQHETIDKLIKINGKLQDKLLELEKQLGTLLAQPNGKSKKGR